MIPKIWTDVIPTIADWFGPCVDASAAIRIPALNVATAGHVGFYYSPEFKKYAVYAHEDATDADLEKTIKLAKAIGPTRLTPLTLDDVDQQPWVKVAYSQTLKTIGENLNFIPGKYLGTIPNHPNPLAATLTSSLVGAGLGYGAGRLAKAIAPTGWGDKLPTTLAALGGLGGAGTAALIRGYPSYAEGKSLLSNWPFSDNDEAVETETGDSIMPKSTELSDDTLDTLTNIIGAFHGGKTKQTNQAKAPRPPKISSDKHAEFETFAPALPLPSAPTPFDVNVNALGQTLWQTGASPQVAAGTMATMYAASQMPSQRQVPGYVMGDQLGRLAMNAAGDYTKGLLAGYAINTAIGSPYKPSQFGMGNAAIGIIGSVIPKIFGQ